MSTPPITPPVIDTTPQAPSPAITQPTPQQSMPAPEVPTEAPNQTSSLAMPPQPHHSALAGILGALAGPTTIHHVNPVTGQMDTITAPSAPGDAFKKIVAGALTGMAVGGAAGRTGGGFLGGLGAGGAANMQRLQEANQRDIQNQENDFKTQQQAQLQAATVAHLNQEVAASQWQATREQWEIQQHSADNMNKMAQLVQSDPANRDLGHYDSFDEFIQKHPELAPEIPQLQAKGLLQVVPEFDGKKPAGLSIYEIHPGWADQKNDKPMHISFIDAEDNVQTMDIPKGGITNGDALKAQLASFKANMDAAKAKAANETKEKTAQIRVSVAGAGKADARNDKSYQFNSGQLEKFATPIEQKEQRFNQLSTTLKQNSPAADSLVAPELLSVVVGGPGSNLRMSEAEIQRIVGGKNNWEKLKSQVLAWQADPNKPFQLLPSQRQQVAKLLDESGKNIHAQVERIGKARQALVDAESPEEHRQILADMHKDLDTGITPQVPQGQPTPQSHTFSKAAFLQANPKGDVNKAAADAKAAGYAVTD